MKAIKYLLIIPLLGVIFVGTAATITVTGVVTQNGSPKSGVPVYWEDSTSTNSARDTTDSRGMYSLQINTGSATQGMLWGYINSCNGSRKYGNFFYNSGSRTYTHNFIYCANGAAPFTATINGNLQGATSGISVYADTLGGVFANSSTVTSSNGNYSLTLVCRNSPQDIWVWIVDCKNDTIVKKVTASGTTSTINNVNFLYCRSTGGGSNISGTVYNGNMPAMDATVLLIEKHNGFLKAIDTAKVQRGWYSFANPDTTREYLIKAFLNKTDSFYRMYLPTYSDRTTKWNLGNLVNKGSGQVTRNVNLVKGRNNGGPGFIAGRAVVGANRSSNPGDAIEGAEIHIYQGTDAVAYTYSDANGDFKIENLAMGTYIIHVEALGKSTDSIEVTLTWNDPAVNNVEVTINDKEANVTLRPTSLDELENSVKVAIYPNPVSSSLNVNLGMEATNVEVSVLDMTGSLVQTVEVVHASTLNVDMSDLIDGTYILMINSDKVSEVIRVIKH